MWMDRIKSFLRRRSAAKRQSASETVVLRTEPASARVSVPETVLKQIDDGSPATGREIDFSRTDDLESYVENLNVPAREIEQWIAAGLLFPEEIRVAERMLAILRKRPSDVATFLQPTASD
jgi:hypothetical protein